MDLKTQKVGVDFYFFFVVLWERERKRERQNEKKKKKKFTHLLRTHTRHHTPHTHRKKKKKNGRDEKIKNFAVEKRTKRPSVVPKQNKKKKEKKKMASLQWGLMYSTLLVEVFFCFVVFCRSCLQRVFCPQKTCHVFPVENIMYVYHTKKISYC